MRRLLLLASLLLASCQSTEHPAPVSLRAPMLKHIVPKTLMQCLPEPNGQHVTTAREAALYIVDLKGAGRDCRRKLATVRGLIQGETR